MTRCVLVAGGGTAGHVFPSLAVARELQRLAPDIEPVFVGTEDRLEGRLVPEAGYRMHHIDVLPLPRRLTVGLLRVPGALRRAGRRCVEIIREEGAVGAVTFGGYVSFPLDWACDRTLLPLVIHEQNSVPGLANRFAARWSDAVAVSFPGSANRFPRPERVSVTGNPVREQILAAADRIDRTAARRHFGLAPDRTTLLVFGGSQGARSINEAIVASHRHWRRPGALQILHAAGEQLYDEAVGAWHEVRFPTGGGAGASGPDGGRMRAPGVGGPGGGVPWGTTSVPLPEPGPAPDREVDPLVRCVDFIDDMAAAYVAADVVVCRAGATSIAELTALGRPALLVPYPHATRDHQLHNARALAAAGGARVVADAELTGTALVEAVEPWLLDDVRRREAADMARAFGRRDAAGNVARLLLDVLDREVSIS